ncbi:MAG TPA: hypothetical protein ENK13_03270, partial [Thermopetrobacter sp.]|nr:hypothetical protein [Thermopetrobacter sp.]
DAPLDFAAGEITDKGSINQRLVLRRRAAQVARLWDDADPEVIRPAPAGAADDAADEATDEATGESTGEGAP